jgi:hypothetical protein
MEKPQPGLAVFLIKRQILAGMCYNVCSNMCYKESIMEFIPYRMLRNEPTALRKKLADQGELIVTVEGKPFAVMIDLTSNESMEDILLMVSRLRAQMAVREVRSQARRKGLDEVSDADIDALIQKTRAERKA